MTLKLFKSNWQYVTLAQRYYSSSRNENHYDVLKLPRNCSKKQIKDSFIRLSKQHHPDISSSKEAHAKFLKIKEAYNVLSKPESRNLYDLSLSNQIPPNVKNCTNVYYGNDPYADPSFYRNRMGRMEKDDGVYDDDYYGIGIKRQPNYVIAGLCVLLAAVTFALQMYIAYNSFTFRRDLLLQRSLENEETLRQIKKQAEENGNEKQLELLKQKFSEQFPDQKF